MADIQEEGFLKKKGAGLGGSAKRYFVLQGHKLVYYKGESKVSSEEKGFIDLREAAVGGDGSMTGFHISGPNTKRKFELQASNNSEKEKWMKVINEAIAQSKANPRGGYSGSSSPQAAVAAASAPTTTSQKSPRGGSAATNNSSGASTNNNSGASPKQDNSSSPKTSSTTTNATPSNSSSGSSAASPPPPPQQKQEPQKPLHPQHEMNNCARLPATTSQAVGGKKPLMMEQRIADKHHQEKLETDANAGKKPKPKAPKPQLKPGFGDKSVQGLCTGRQGKWLDDLAAPKAVIKCTNPPNHMVMKTNMAYGVPGSLGVLNWRTLKLRVFVQGAEHQWYHLWFFVKEDELKQPDLDCIQLGRCHMALMSKLNDDMFKNTLCGALKKFKGTCFGHYEFFENSDAENKFPGLFLVVVPESCIVHMRKTFVSEVLENE